MTVTWQPAPHAAALEVPGVTTDRRAIHAARSSATPDALWVADISQIWAGTSWMHFAFVLDRGSRRCLGWWPHRVLHSEMVVGAVRTAIAARPTDDGKRPAAVPIVFGHRCREVGIDFPHWATCCAPDAALVRAFLTALRSDLLDGGDEDSWASHPEAEGAIRTWIRDIYNVNPAIRQARFRRGAAERSDRVRERAG